MAQLLVCFATTKCSPHVIKWFNRHFNPCMLAYWMYINARSEHGGEKKLQLSLCVCLISPENQKNKNLKIQWFDIYFTREWGMWKPLTETRRHDNTGRVFTSVWSVHRHSSVATTNPTFCLIPAKKEKTKKNVPEFTIRSSFILQSSCRWHHEVISSGSVVAVQTECGICSGNVLQMCFFVPFFPIFKMGVKYQIALKHSRF